MRTKRMRLRIILALVIVTQCLLPFERRTKEIVLEEVLSIGKVDDDILFQWVGVAVDSDGALYVTDAMDHSLKKFDAHGKLLKKAGRKGQGPGEFMALRYLGSSEDFLYVTDQNRLEIQVFDKELNYRKSIRIPFPVVNFKILSDDDLAVHALGVEEAGKILIYSSEGKIKREWKYTDKKMPFMMDVVSFDFDSQGNLYLAFNFQDKIEKFGRENKKLWSKKFLGIKKVKKETLASIPLPTQFVYKDIAIDSLDRLFVLGGSFSQNPSRDVYVFSPEGKLLATFTLPDTTHCIYIDSQDFLYSRANEGITLKKFRFHFKDG